METIAHEVLKDEALAAEAASLKKEIHDAIESMAIVDNYYYGKVYAYGPRASCACPHRYFLVFRIASFSSFVLLVRPWIARAICQM